MPNKFFRGFVYGMCLVLPFWIMVCIIILWSTQ
jgi:hypothetical protein